MKPKKKDYLSERGKRGDKRKFRKALANVREWGPITKEMPNPISIVLLLDKDKNWDVGQRNRPGGAGFTTFHKKGNHQRRGFTHYCPILWPGEDA
jgi:hypothetical protein